ncbi:hypothetical protein N665_0532s0006 [Sinapis alba]|nr:hypothetical protein N665_0532s0006 [Sinapis alba]
MSRCACGSPRGPGEKPGPSRLWPAPATENPARPATKTGLNLCNQSRPASIPNRPDPRAGGKIAISIEDHEAPALLFRQIKLKKQGMPELDQLHQDSRYREMTRAGTIFFGNVNLMVRDYEALLAEKSEALEKAEFKRSRNELYSAELEALKAQKELLDSRCFSLEQEKSELSLNFETTARRLRESREHEVRKERSRVESALRQQVMPIYEKMGQFIREQTEIQSKLALYSQAKGTREGLEKIQSQGLSMDEVLQKAKIDEAHFLEKLQKMEIVDASEINLLPIGLDEHGSNMTTFSPQDIEDLRT